MALSKHAILSSAEKTSINISIASISTRLKSFFPNELETHFRFGSSVRRTILPRKYDLRSDIDYLVVFNDGQFTPQTYLDRLKRFSNFYYKTSVVRQDFPSVTLNLNHIKFDLVPSVNYWWSGYKIPNNSGNWIETDPNGFSKELETKNVGCSSLIKPCIRLLKIWNAKAGYVFDSYDLEQQVAQMGFLWVDNNLKAYVFHSFRQLHLSVFTASWKIEALGRLKRRLDRIEVLSGQGFEGSAQKLMSEVFIQPSKTAT
ncbi:MAG: hypothetical protein COB08_004800 [Rhodobacteraceae bacterium]|nr:hypothetical protein [Paracoccaceae bacterium]